jgi:DNA-binding response OmpR family regulator
VAGPPTFRGARVLVVQSDQNLAQALTGHLRHAEFVVDVTLAADEAESLARARPPDLVVLDPTLPDGDGFPLFRRLGAGGAVPVVMVSPAANEADRVQGLELGADDFLSPLVSEAELVARVRSVLRRTHSARPRSSRVVLGPIEADERSHRCLVSGQPVALTALEFKLLLYFLRHPNEACTRERLLEHVWGFSTGGTATVTVHIRRLREKIEPDPARPTLIQTVWGVGYRLDAGDLSW